ncbi:BTAD domain-containing putative transcriptional regulator [Kribbella sandramycini]
MRLDPGPGLLPGAYHVPMEFRLLGPVEIWSAGHPVVLKRRQERLVLAVLLLEPGKPVAADRLIALLWPEASPSNPRRALQVYISRLRAVVDADLTSGPEGYAVQAAPGSTDIEQFRTLITQARGESDLGLRTKLATDALSLWRGPALADVTTDDVRRRLCSGLEEERWAAEELQISTELALGHHQDLLPRLAELAAAEPTRESFAAALMLALYRSGRQTDALAVYTELVRHLDEELGVEPGTELRDLQVAILRQDPSLDLLIQAAVPRELPADVSLLIGRDDVLTELSATLKSGGHTGVPTVVCLYGAAGTGKSAAAVRLGHLLADSFPDGQLFARLQDVNGHALPPRAVLGQLLRSLGVDGSELPDALEERSALLRSRLANKSTLLLFDDAVDAGQLRPLLPAAGAVITTSRTPLLGLEDATHRELHPLDHTTSAQLLGALSGLPAAHLTEVVPHCAGLPLALRIVGARLALIREPVSHVVQSLADESRRLDYLVAGDRAVRASLDLTLALATPEAQALFTRLAIVTADEFGPWVAAALLDTDETSVAAVLDSLTALGLIQLRRVAPPRYGLHGLLRARTAELYADLERPDRDVYESRYLDTVLRLLTIADAAIDHSLVSQIEVDPGGGPALPAIEAAAAAGADWLDGEVSVIRAAVERAAGPWPRSAGMLAVRFRGYLLVRDSRDDRLAVLQTARDAVAGTADVGLEAELDRSLFGVFAQADAAPELLAELAERAVDSARRAGSVPLLLGALNQVCWAAGARADYERMLAVADEMYELAEHDPAADQSWALDQQYGALYGLGRIAEAQKVARAICRVDDTQSRTRAIRLVMLAEALLAEPDLGVRHTAELQTHVREAQQIVERLGDELGLAHVLAMAAQVLVITGRLSEAGEVLLRAEEILDRRPNAGGRVRVAIGWARLLFVAGRVGEAHQTLSAAIPGATLEGAHELRQQLGLLGEG